MKTLEVIVLDLRTVLHGLYFSDLHIKLLKKSHLIMISMPTMP